jgi:hypothetical protein
VGNLTNLGVKTTRNIVWIKVEQISHSSGERFIRDGYREKYFQYGSFV